MGKFKNGLRNFFYGRYGIDQFYNFLIAVYFILMVSAIVVATTAGGTTGGVIAYYILDALCMILLIYIFFRILSRNTAKRSAENERFMRIWRKIFKKKHKNNFRMGGVMPNDTKDYVFRACKYCGVTLRLPNESGKHTVRCPRCGRVFEVKV